MYKVYSVPKPRGGYRTITEPEPSLKALQQSIQPYLEMFPLNPNVHGFVPGKSTLSNAFPHRNQRYVLNLDLKDFFPSVKKDLLMPWLWNYVDMGLLKSDVITWVASCCFHEGALPQGAPTSPVLSNIYASPIDDSCALLAHETGFTFTRYADDITFSGDDSLKERKGYVVETLRAELARHSLRLNPKKIKLMPYYQRQKVTGIVVNNDKLTLARPFKEEIFLEVKGSSMSEFSPNFLGLLEYIRSVDPVFHNKLLRNSKVNEDGKDA